ncbi:PAS domain S-box protein [Priestia megaterium]|nr:PAS domain S-box protein [Priestia megaterium]
MTIKELLINLSVFTFLSSLAILVHLFTTHKTFKSSQFIKGCYTGIVAAVLIFFHFESMRLAYAFPIVPLILSFIYFGRTAGWITLLFILTMRIFYIGEYSEASIFVSVGISVLFTIFRTCLKNLHRFKSAFLYLISYIMIRFTVSLFSPVPLSTPFEIKSQLLTCFELLVGLFLMESYQRISRLTHDLSDLKQSWNESKQELKETVHELQGGIFKFKKINGSFIYTMCDGQFFYRSGLDPKHVVGKCLQDIDPSLLPPPHLINQKLNYYHRAWKGKEVTFELPWPNSSTYILISLRPVARDGKVVEVVGSVTDITDRKKMEEELQVTKDRLESFINHNIDAIVITDLEGHILQANTAYEKIFGWSPQEVIGEQLPCVPKFLMEQALADIQQIVSGESVITKFETVRSRKDSSLIDVHLTISPILDSDGTVTALSVILRDISERKQGEKKLYQLHQQLQESELKYRALFEHAMDAVYLYEVNEDQILTKCLDINPVGCERLQYSKEEFLSRPPYKISPQVNEVFNKVTAELKKGKDSFIIQNEYVLCNGQKLYAEISFRFFTLAEKNVLLCISRDITERIKTEELLRKSEKLAVVGQLATAIAHEIRNPLTSMKGFLQLLKSTESESNQFYIDLMLSESNRIESITNEFMTVAKPQAMSIQPNNLPVLIKQVITLLQPQATMNNVQIMTKIAAHVPLVACESDQLKQVFINILKNAIEAMPAGGEILVQINKVDQHINIRFIDQGCGIPKERLPYLGEPFYSIKEGGIGLGLMICYKIIETHQGKIVIESEVNKGTTVEIILPIHCSPSEQQAHSLELKER